MSIERVLIIILLVLLIVYLAERNV